MAGTASHFIVDMWTNKVLNKLLSGVENSIKVKTVKAGNPTVFLKEQSLDEEIDISLVGPTLWSPTWEGYYTEPVGQVQSTDANSLVTAPKRRANNFTSSGRLTASLMYQELSKSNIDAHRLVDPYDYGEQLGPAENISQPFKIDVHPQVGFLTDLHGHLCDSEVIGLLAGKWDAVSKKLHVQAAFPCAATERHEDFGFTDVELDPEAEWQVREAISALGLEVVGWYHSHPKFKPSPSVMDIFNQQQYQLYTRDENTGEEPFVGLIVSTYDTSLSSPVSEHQWFTVLPYTPPVRRNSIIDEDLPETDVPARSSRGDSSHKGSKEDSGPRYMPMRMQVNYLSVHLETAFLMDAELPSSEVAAPGKKASARTAGKVAAPFTAPLMKSLMALRVNAEALTYGDATRSSSAKIESVAAEVKSEEKDTELVVLTKRKYTPRRPKAELEAMISEDESGLGESDAHASAKKIKEEVTRKTLSAKLLAGHEKGAVVDAAPVASTAIEQNPVTSSALRALADLTKLSTKSLIGRGKKSAASNDSEKSSAQDNDEINSLKGSSSAVSLESREAHSNANVTASLKSAFIDSVGDFGQLAGIVSVEKDSNEGQDVQNGLVPPKDSGDASYWGSLSDSAAPAQEENGPDATATTGVTPSVSAVTLNTTEPDSLPTNNTAGTADAVTEDAALASRLQAEEQALQASTSSRRPAREIKKVSREDYVDTLEVTKHIRKQNMDNVRAMELKLKQKAAAERASKKAAVMTVPVEFHASTEETAASNTSKKQKRTAEGETDLKKGSGKAPAKGKKGTKEDPCVDCFVPPFNVDSTLCTTIPAPRKKPTAKDPTAVTAPSESTSIILALQDPQRPSAALAREMLCSVLPAYRGLVLVVISMGMYYARSPRRVDWAKGWKGHVRIEKVKASAAVWLARLGLAPSEAAEALGPSTSSQITDAVANGETSVGDASDSKNGDGCANGEAVVSAERAGTNGNGIISNGTSVETTTATTITASNQSINSNTHYLTEWVGQYLLACWEDYSRLQNRKRKA